MTLKGRLELLFIKLIVASFKAALFITPREKKKLKVTRDTFP